MVFPGTVSAATFSAVPFTLTTASFRDIDSWLPTIGSLPTSQYVNKLIVATPMKIDVDIQPTCPSCEADAEAVLDSQTDYYCTQQCDWYQEHGPFQPISKVSGTFRLNIDDGRECYACSVRNLRLYSNSDTGLSLGTYCRSRANRTAAGKASDFDFLNISNCMLPSTDVS